MSPKTKSTNGKSRRDPGMSGVDALKYLFTCWPQFTKLKGFKGSHDTRNPAHYDMHLHSQLILKDIVSFPDMFDQLDGVVDSKIKPFLSRNAAIQLPRIEASSILRPEAVSRVLNEDSNWIVSHEATLQKSYPTLQEYPSLVASTLLAGLDEWSTIFRFGPKPRVATACAEADGYLSLNKAAIESPKLSKDLKDTLQLVIDKDILFWEFKSMNAGTKGVMLAISHLVGSQFPWFNCPASKPCGSQFCRKKNNRFRFTVTGNRTGVDGTMLENRFNEEDSSIGFSFVFDESKLDCPVRPVRDTRRWKFKISRQPKKRARPESDNRHSTDDKRDDDSDHEDGDDDGERNDGECDDDALPFTEVDYQKALKIVQQIWAEAVNIDATFIVLNCANLEYIGIRDRKRQRLHLSPLLDLQNPKPSTPGYFKIHTGLEIVALMDAIDRAERFKALPQDPELYTFEYDRSEPYVDKVPPNTKTRRPSKTANTPRKGTKTKDNAKEEEDDSQKMDFTPAELHLFHRLRHARSLKISWKKNLRRLGPPGSMLVTRTSAWPAHMDGWTGEMEVFVLDRYPDSMLSYACYVNDGETTVCGIVVKLAKFPDQEIGLRREYDMYTKFPMINGIVDRLGIVKQFGLYRYSGDNTTALVLLDGGVSISDKFGPGHTPANI
ncbi:hypothetical protein IW262DRAFT_1454437 [Armillaria fumosa]|nr:hypothetical protein IW262DRAFT_1454437 [Armillaria fumosa]